jgi:hypothetical protein
MFELGGTGLRLNVALLPVLPWDMVDKSISPLQTSFRLFFVSGSSGQATPS